MTSFKTLLLREWMQHGRGWQLLCAVPLGLMLLSIIFGGVQADAREAHAAVAVVIGGGYALAVIFLGWMVLGLQASGLGRRDQQDRSIEFWRSLPVSDVQSVAATALTHLVLLPLGLSLVAVASGLVIAPLVVLRLVGLSELLQLPWRDLAAAVAAGVPRLLLGSLLASVWAAPLLLLGMAASAWLKRWGLPLAVVVLAGGSAILRIAYGLPWLSQTLQGLCVNFGAALVPGTRAGGTAFPSHQLSDLPAWLWQDAQGVLGELASPLFAVALLTSAVAFALVVWRRRFA